MSKVNGDSAVSLCWTAEGDELDELATRFGCDRWIVPPVRQGDVRGAISLSGIYLEPGNTPTRSRVSYAVQIDLKGWIPHFLANWVADGQAYNVWRARNYYRERKEKDEDLRRPERQETGQILT
mmetsp:Transcript_4867/g.9845  ORF Transcript_4867/g.9845 Transcript_4867/m.9845 type:complete len:124 (+) Transcript_4867:604-975(+)